MVVSNIKPIKKSVGSYENYIFGEPHNKRKERNLLVFGVGNCEGVKPNQMGLVLKSEREMFPSKRRKHEAYTLVIAFSDELTPDDPRDWQKAASITKEIVETAYPNRSAMIAIQRDGKSGLLHAHVLLNNVDSKGKALRENGWKHLKKTTDTVIVKHGLTPLTEKRENSSHYDWRRDLAFKIKETCGDSEALAEMGITLKKRKSKKYPPAVTSFSFLDRQGKKRNIRGRQLASQLNLPTNYFDIAQLQQMKLEQTKTISSLNQELKIQKPTLQLMNSSTHKSNDLTL